MKQNRLSNEKSPYLLQHQHNPVDWYPWGDEAFKKAERDDKPVFLSIGYATCHWCHVMEHESFEDQSVAALMNREFISIKVDREERPDIDNFYMTVCQIAGGHCGWPLTVLLTPDRKPFYVATYLPRMSAHGRVGMMDLIPRIGELWRNEKDKILESAENLVAAVTQIEAREAGSSGVDPDWLTIAARQLAERFDNENGGFGTAPKFPTPHNLLFLLRHWSRAGDSELLHMVESTLRKMRAGGVYDHLGFGFHRYSTDAQWRLPHFEKMLYDQALLMMVYVETYEATRDRYYLEIATEIADYVLRDLVSPEGGFYSAEDADSEGEEGKFYVWKTSEVRALLSSVEADLFIEAFGLEPDGNFLEESTRRKIGTNIIARAIDDDELARSSSRSRDEVGRQLSAARSTLFDERTRRIRPLLDDKILTDWNGLMIAALSRVGHAGGDVRYLGAAGRAAAFVLNRLRTPDGRLLHRFRDDDAAIDAGIADYAFLIWGLIELHQATQRTGHLADALALTKLAIGEFWDDDDGAFFLTTSRSNTVPVRQKDIDDGAIPSGNSIMLLNLARLARFTGDMSLESRATSIVNYSASTVGRIPSAFTGFLIGADFLLGPSSEIVVVSEQQSDETDAMLATIAERYLPRKVVLLRTDRNASELATLAPFQLEYPVGSDGSPVAYLCQNFSCQAPARTPTELASGLDELQSG